MSWVDSRLTVGAVYDRAFFDEGLANPQEKTRGHRPRLQLIRMRFARYFSADRGATLLEMAITMTVIAVLVSGFGTATYSVLVRSRDDAVINQLESIKRGIIGEPRSVAAGEMGGTRHGYIGDMGSLPPSLSSLETAGSQPDFAVDPLLQLGRGWRGPYVSSIVAGGMTDPWGSPIVYSTTPGTSALTGASVVASLRSYGPDGQNGTSDDRMLEIYRSEAFADVIGYVKDAFGATVPGIDVLLSYTSNGVIIQPPVAAVTDNNGLYSYSNIPHGTRVIQLKPKISYVKGTGFTTGGNRNNLEFVVENLSKDSLTISSIKLSWVTDPPSDFKRLNVKGVERYEGTAASATTLTFPNELVSGTGVIQEPFRVDVSGLVMLVPDAVIGTVGTSGTLAFQMEDFEEVGTGTDIDVTGVTFTAEFTLVSPAGTSKTLFSPLRK